MFRYILTIAIAASVINVLSAIQNLNEIREIDLWKGTLPNGPGPQRQEKVSSHGSYTSISRPRLIVHIPQHSIGTAMLVIGGGGYARVQIGKESTPASKWLQSIGVTAFELLYRLPTEGWSSVDVPFQDGQRAMRLIRSLAEKFGFAANKIGIMGFSSGGHLAGMIETEPDKQLYKQIDSVDKLSARPDFAALLYPIITMLPPFNHTHAEKIILGKNQDRNQQNNYSVQLHVSSETPPTFLAQASDDHISNVENSKLMYSMLQKFNVIAELHLFETGGHGWVLGRPETAEQVWPKLFRTWAQTNGFL